MRNRKRLCGKHKVKRVSHIYRGHVSGQEQKVIVASNPNEAYALMLDALAGKKYEANEVYADPENDRHIQAYYKRYPIGVYERKKALNFINQLKVV